MTALSTYRVVCVGRLAKGVAVGLRFGCSLAPAALVASLVNALRVTTSPYPAFMAELMTLLVEDGSADGVVAWHRSEAQARLDMAREILPPDSRSEEHTSELQSLMRISYAVFCLTKKKRH